ncbi:MAG TPA: hypothetical protein PKX56_01525 [Marmoricola sp.]|nr:hypothetical protein [Marmoricola sp.]HNI70152.1 hypothetical protein [Marmoricola sp.]HNJ78006.1 hypothetical protein [Marmoricola sp.]HNO40436.1 hypothetical protein [Marmoricola sp.]
MQSKSLASLVILLSTLLALSSCSINIGPGRAQPTVTVTAQPSASPSDDAAFKVPTDLRVDDNAEQTAFITPSGNITCAIFAFEGPAELRCDITNHTWQPPTKPADCPLDWGTAITLTESPGFGCVGDTVFGIPTPDSSATWWWGRSKSDALVTMYDQKYRALSVGTGIQRAPFQCVSIAGGVDCRNLQSGGRFILTDSSYEFLPSGP